MKTERRLLGDFGEKIAARFLRRRRYRILEKNFVSGHHEIDLIAENAEFLVFVEVKTRTYSEAYIERYGSAASAVDFKKQKSLVSAALDYLRNSKNKKRIRFDVIEIYVSKDDPSVICDIHHMLDAFRP